MIEIEHVVSDNGIRLRFDGTQFWFAFSTGEFYALAETPEFKQLERHAIDPERLNGFLDAVAKVMDMVALYPSGWRRVPTSEEQRRAAAREWWERDSLAWMSAENDSV